MTNVLKYINANKASYKFDICKIGNNVYDELAYWQKENFPDLKISRPNVRTDLSLISSKCLFTINGFVYNSFYENNYIYIKNATKNMLKSKSNQVGILSFLSLNSPLNKIKIRPEMITGETNFSLYEKSLITFETNIQYPIFIIAGYILFEDGETIYRVSPNTFAIRLDKLNYIEKLYELYRYRDIFDELNISISNLNPFTIDANIVKSDATIIKFLSFENSFILNFNIPFALTKIYLERSNIPSSFRTDIEPVLPLFGGYGKIIEYSKTSNLVSKYNVYTLDSFYNNHLLSKLPFTTIETMNDSRIPENTYRLNHAYFLKISF